MSDAENPQPLSSIEEILASARQGLEAIEKIAEAAKVHASTAAEDQRLTTAALGEAQAKLAEVSSIATLALSAKTQIDDSQGVIATKSDHIQGAQEHADKVRADLDRVLTAATQQGTEAEGLKSRTQTASDDATALLAEIRAAKASVESDSAAIVAARDLARESTDQTKALADKAANVEQRIGAYEARLEELEKLARVNLDTIVGLLPGATSAGLAHAFDERRQTFLKPRVRWQWVFVGSLITIVVLAVSGLWHVYFSGANLSYDDLLRLWLARLPVAGALVWLALHASHESSLAKRLEEDYGYKSAIASSFQGFHKQMADINTAGGPDTPLAMLCADTLATIASPPGRIYDKNKLVVTPSTEMTDVAKSAAEAAIKAVAGSK